MDSTALFEEALRFMPGGVNSPVRAFRAVGGNPFFARRAKGAHLFDVDGRDYVDYVCSWGPMIFGHAVDFVEKAAIAALREGASFGVPNPWEVRMARFICESLPGLDKVRMCNSGTEATMSCVRLARGFTGRDAIVKFEGCYHGHVDSLLVSAGSGALTFGKPDSAGIPACVAAQTIVLPFNDCGAVEDVFARMEGRIAGVILEPIPANCGLILPDINFLLALRQRCTEQGTVLIFDEVMTGFRLGRAGAQGLLGIQPDLTALGKVIGGGFPVGAFGGKASIMGYLAPEGPVYQAGTLSGNPVAMAAGLAQLETLARDNSYERLEQIGAKLEVGFRETLERAGVTHRFYRVGSMFCLYFTDQDVCDLSGAKRSDTEKFKRYFHDMLAKGVYVPPSQFEGNFISLAHGQAEIERTLEALREAVK